MKLMPLIFVAGLFMPSPGIAADRLTDQEVKALVARVEQDRDRFDDALDGKLKQTILRGPSGEVNVDKYLNDFQESIDRVEERLKPGYAASAEVATLLHHGSAIDAFLRQQPAGTKGASEWNKLAADLKTLAAAYGADFPLAANGAVRRIGDGEVAAAADAIAKSAERLKKALDTDLKKDASIDKPTREGIVGEADQMSKDAKALRDRVKDGKPSSAEADRLLAQAAKLQAFIESHKAPTSSSAWSGFSTPLQSVAGAYGIPRSSGGR